MLSGIFFCTGKLAKIIVYRDKMEKKKISVQRVQRTIKTDQSSNKELTNKSLRDLTASTQCFTENGQQRSKLSIDLNSIRESLEQQNGKSMEILEWAKQRSKKRGHQSSNGSSLLQTIYCANIQKLPSTCPKKTHGKRSTQTCKLEEKTARNSLTKLVRQQREMIVRMPSANSAHFRT